MLYHALREAARLALRWHYGDIITQGSARIPRDAPVLFVANHPNALVDALVVAVIVPRRIWLTAKATLFEHPLLAPLLQAVGVVPLRRAADERNRRGTVTTDRNEDSFRVVTESLLRRRAVLVFPEGISHDEPALAPLRTGAARMALAAHAAGATGLVIVPVGLIFEEKERPRSRVLVRIGEPIAVDDWVAAHGDRNPTALTGVVSERLHSVTLNFADAERAARAVGIARALAATTAELPPLGARPPLSVEADIAARVERATTALDSAPSALASRADAFVARLGRLESRLSTKRIALSEAMVSPRLSHGARFVARETVLSLVSLPVALLGWLTHWLPIWIARTMALRSLRNDPSRDQPAMRTIVIGLAVLIAWYALQAMLVGRWWGAWAAGGWIVLILLAAQVQLKFADRLARARRRASAYLALRRDPVFRVELRDELLALREEASSLEQCLVDGSGGIRT